MLADLIQDVIQKFELEATRKGIELRAEMPMEAPLVIGDIGLIERVLRNLIDNSLHFTPAGGSNWLTQASPPPSMRYRSRQ